MIRQATIKDLPLLMEWRMTVLREVFSLSANADLSELEAANEAYYKTALSDGTHIACYAAENEKIVGCGGICLHTEMPSPDNPNGKCAYLMNVFVSPEYRGKGYGKQIVEWLIQKAIENEATKIYLESSQSGKKVYEKAGFVVLPEMMIWKQHI